MAALYGETTPSIKGLMRLGCAVHSAQYKGLDKLGQILAERAAESAEG
jgi:hypothetical protein